MRPVVFMVFTCSKARELSEKLELTGTEESALPLAVNAEVVEDSGRLLTSTNQELNEEKGKYASVHVQCYNY